MTGGSSVSAQDWYVSVWRANGRGKRAERPSHEGTGQGDSVASIRLGLSTAGCSQRYFGLSE